MFHLFGIPTPADAKEEATTGEPIEAGDLFGSDDRIALR